MPIRKDSEGIEILTLQKAVTFSRRRVLEIGCGDGRLTWRIAPSASRVVGIDTDAETLRTAIAACPDDLQQTVSFINANSLDLPFPHKEFDLIILSWAL